MDSKSFNFSLGLKLAVAYIRSHYLLFILSSAIGLGLVFWSPKVLELINSQKRTLIIGVVGNVTTANIPLSIQEKLSLGLTSIGEDGKPVSSVASEFYATDSGKKFVFKLKRDLRWHDGTLLKPEEIAYTLKGVKIEKHDDEITFILPNSFAPLPSLLSQPLFKTGTYKTLPFLPGFINDLLYQTGLIGLGEYSLDGIKFNSRFISQLNLVSLKDGSKITYRFYPSSEALLAGLKLGQINAIESVYERPKLDEKYYLITETVQPNFEAILFFNTAVEPFSEKNFRQGLTYALPNTFEEGESTDTPLPKNSWAKSSAAKKYPQNLDLADSLVGKVASKSSGFRMTIKLSTTPMLLSTAYEIKSNWAKIGIDTNIEVTDTPPTRFQAYLALVELPTDPDQYFLWDSTQETNISSYNSPKVDRLLEDGRQSTDQRVRLINYVDFQKAITEDCPAAFLYYPKVYSVVRKF